MQNGEVENEARFRALVEVTSDWIWEVDDKGVYVYCSPKVKDFLGYEPEEILGKTPFDLMPAGEAERMAGIYSEIIKSKKTFHSVENINLHREGYQVILETSGVPVFDDQGSLTGYRGIDRNISDRMQARVAQQSSDFHYRLLVESQKITHIGHWEWNFLNNEFTWSDELYRICGYEPGEIAPNYNLFLNLIHEGDRDRWEKALGKNYSKSDFDIDFRIVLGQDDIRHVHAQGKMHYNDSGQPVSMVVTVQNISERKHLENALNTITSFSAATDIAEYFRVCVKNFASIYNTRYAFIGLFSDESEQKITTQAVWVDGKFIENFEYDLTGTPCTDVLSMDVELIAKDVSKLYPDNSMLINMDVESYFGAPMISSSGKKIGIVAVLDTNPMVVSSWIESILGLFAQRIASYIEAKQVSEKLITSENELQNIFRNMQDTYYRVDGEGVITRVSEASEQLIGYHEDELVGRNIIDFYDDPDRRQQLLDQLHNDNGRVQNFELGLKHKNGSVVWVSTNAHYYSDTQNNIIGIEGVARDMTQHHENEIQMQKMSSALEQSVDMVMVTDQHGLVEYVNPAFENITGYLHNEIIGKPFKFLKSGKQGEKFYRNLWRTILAGEVFRDVLVNRKKNGDLYFEEKTITPIKNPQGKIINFVATGRDISERMKNEERLSFMAHHDALTDLPNRTLFMDHLKHSLAHARRHSTRVAVLFIDLDRFKNINDTLGHDVGDQLLSQVAERLEKNIRKDDTVARLGGDEFAVIINDIDTEQDAAFLAKKLLAGLEEPLELDHRELFITASIGISLYPNNGEDAGTLLKNADIAMYKAKDLGKNNFQFYSTEMSARAFHRLTMESNLLRALERKEFVLFYQPQIDIKTNRIAGVEALIRWKHPELGLIPPGDFIPLLEETGLITQVGYWILVSACKQIKEWHSNGFSELIMSVNISGRQFHEPDFINKIESILKTNSCSPSMIEMEITESVLMKNQRKTIIALEALGQMGFKIALDDFGTGYSSLSYLRRFKIDTLKVDQSFVRDVIDDPDDAAITAAIIVMAQSLHLKVIAEGVENQEQLDFLVQHKCPYVQGYFFSRPLPADEVTQLLLNQ